MEMKEEKSNGDSMTEKQDPYTTGLRFRLLWQYGLEVSREVPDNNQAVRHALELPLHWRVEWIDARWQIQAYEEDNVRD
ncbi:hypothetical protein CRG98_006657 [Punica granatum]|uniref:Uncharacterized protein n=1 Tax=Punica granatum TaxID=22663 RepID=A0A2I0KWW2_PUNGR|nr:hypothetical protein CRG98_006657 [Punica granatum]